MCLGEAINQWIQHHFFRAKRAKCLILIGPTSVGKTSFALSLYLVVSTISKDDGI